MAILAGMECLTNRSISSNGDHNTDASAYSDLEPLLDQKAILQSFIFSIANSLAIFKCFFQKF